MFESVPLEVERVATDVIGAAIEVHRCLGPGFLERIYEDALCLELALRSVPFARQVPLTVDYKGVPIPGQRLDLIVSGVVVLELKAAVKVHESCEPRLISYLRTARLRLGLILNFNARTMKEGIKRIVV